MAGLYGDTLVSTDRGLRPIRELATHGEAIVRSEYGRWTRAEFGCLGPQPLMRVELTRMKATKIIHATQDHAWLTISAGAGNTARQSVSTTDLKLGDYLVANFGRGATGSLCDLGVMRGIVYGDGHRDGRGSSVDLYGAKQAD